MDTAWHVFHLNTWVVEAGESGKLRSARATQAGLQMLGLSRWPWKLAVTFLCSLSLRMGPTIVLSTKHSHWSPCIFCWGHHTLKSYRIIQTKWSIGFRAESQESDGVTPVWTVVALASPCGSSWDWQRWEHMCSHEIQLLRSEPHRF